MAEKSHSADTEFAADTDTRTQLERMKAGDPYRGDDPEIQALHRRAVVLMAEHSEAYPHRPDEAARIAGELMGRLGANSVVRAPVFVDYGFNIEIGDDVFVNYGLMALDVGRIVIGDHCQIGPNVQLLTPTHPVEPGPRRDKVESSEPITLGANVWLGGGVVVLPGVSIGDDSVVGAGSVVTSDIPAGVVAVGNPARVVKAVTDS